MRFKDFVIAVLLVMLTVGRLPILDAQAQSIPFSLPLPGSRIDLSPSFEPVLIKGLTVHQDNPFLFDFIVDTGHSQFQVASHKSQEEFKKEADRLVKYFFAALTVPEKDLWVNLSPYEKDRMVPEALGKTALGRDLLAQDYILKQLTASLIYPEKDLGREFWNKVYTKAQALYGNNTQIPVNTFNKVWILADKATVYESAASDLSSKSDGRDLAKNNIFGGHGQSAFVVSGHLKVMLEEDYIAMQKQATVGVAEAGVTQRAQLASTMGKAEGQDPNRIGSQIIREIVLPELEKEVNQGKNFASLRQIFNSLILATWYKKNLKEALINQVYADKNIANGVGYEDVSREFGQRDESLGKKPNNARLMTKQMIHVPIRTPEEIYQQYLQAYKKGVFNYIKEEPLTDAQGKPLTNGQTIPRKYFSGGFSANPAMLSVTRDPARGASQVERFMGTPMKVTVNASLDSAIRGNPFINSQIATWIMTLVSILGAVPTSEAQLQPALVAQTDSNSPGFILDTVETKNGGTLTLVGHIHADSNKVTNFIQSMRSSNNKPNIANHFIDDNKVVLGGFTNEIEFVMNKLKDPNPITQIKYFLAEGIPEGVNLKFSSAIDYFGIRKDLGPVTIAQLEESFPQKGKETFDWLKTNGYFKDPTGIKTPKVKKPQEEAYPKAFFSEDKENLRKQFPDEYEKLLSILQMPQQAYLIMAGPVRYIYAVQPDLFSKLQFIPSDSVILQKMSIWMMNQLKAKGYSDEEINSKVFPILLTARNREWADVILSTQIKDLPPDTKPNGIIFCGDYHLKNFEGVVNIQTSVIQQNQGLYPANEGSFWSQEDKEGIRDLLNLSPQDMDEAIDKASTKGTLIENIKESLFFYNETLKTIQSTQDLGDPKQVRVLLLEAFKKIKVVIYQSKPILLVPGEDFKKLSREQQREFLLKGIAEASTMALGAPNAPLAIKQIKSKQVSRWLENIFLNRQESEDKVLMDYQRILDNISLIKEQLGMLKNAPALEDLEFVEHSTIDESKVLIQFFDPKDQKNYKVILENQDGNITASVPDKAMRGEHVTPGGIDLNTRNMRLMVTKGSIQDRPYLSFDPSMMRSLRKQGVTSVTPIIIRIDSMKSAEMKILLGLESVK